MSECSKVLANLFQNRMPHSEGISKKDTNEASCVTVSIVMFHVTYIKLKD